MGSSVLTESEPGVRHLRQSTQRLAEPPKLGKFLGNLHFGSGTDSESNIYRTLRGGVSNEFFVIMAFALPGKYWDEFSGFLQPL